MVIWGNVVGLVIGILFTVIVTASSAASGTRPKFAVVGPSMYVIGVGDLALGIWALSLVLWYRRALNATAQHARYTWAAIPALRRRTP